MSWLRLQAVTLRNIIKAYYHNAKVEFTDKTLTESHFACWSTLDHVNYSAFQKIENLMGGRPQKIIETGTSAWGTESTRFWDSYVRSFGGELWSVDIREEPSRRLRFQKSAHTQLVVGDSVEFLNTSNAAEADVYFLDSWDVDWEDSLAASLHGKKEFDAILPALRVGDLVLIDDTPRDLTFLPHHVHKSAEEFQLQQRAMPGKGGLVVKEISNDPNFEILFHEYALLFKVVNLPK
jgi:hypothetical protein